MSLKKVSASIRKYKKFLLTVHSNPEGDALGSELGMYRLLRKLGKSVVMVNADAVPEEYSLLPGKDLIKVYKPGMTCPGFDCMVVLDCSDMDRTGEVRRLSKRGIPVINIDHHISNAFFGGVNWVSPRASSASEMIFRLFKQMRVPFDHSSALALYVGMMTDTGSFRYSNTTAFTHQAAAELMKYNFNVRLVYKNIYENIPFNELMILTRVLPSFRRTPDGKIVWIELPQKLLKGKKFSFDLTEEILGFGRQVRGASVVALFKENFRRKDEIRFNLRSHGLLDVNKIAKHFGGGGHKTASGCTMRGKLSNVRRLVLAEIRRHLK
jgi:phosphoesterase RecJ-like protein